MRELHAEFGWRSRLATPVAGRYLYRQLKKQQKMLDGGWTYEPPTFYEANFSCEKSLATRVEGIQATSDYSLVSSQTSAEQAVHELESVL